MVFLYTGQQWTVILTILLVGIVLKAALVVWLYRDVRSFGRPTRPWLIAGILAFIPTVIVWRTKRPRVPPPRTPLREPPRQEDERDAPEDPLRVGLVAPVHLPAPDPEAVRSVLQEPAPEVLPGRQVSCPRCTTSFAAPTTAGGPTRVTCPSCGATGHV